MKKLIYVLLSILLVGCWEEEQKVYIYIKNETFRIKVIDSCEYIEVTHRIGYNNGYFSLTHKGNCKFCEERKK